MKKAHQPSVYIVTPVFNHIEHTLKFLESIYQNTYKNFRVVIVDDGSTDNTEAKLKKLYPQTIVLRGNGSLWWSKATNKGVEYALRKGADYILTVNNDVEVKKDWLAQLVACAENNPKSLIGSIIYYMSDRERIWYCGADFDVPKGELYHREDTPKPNEVRKSRWLTGMGVLIPAQTFKDIGLYDALVFPQYFADADFSLRAAQKEYKLLVNTRAVLYNDIANDRGSAIMRQNKLRAILPILLQDTSFDSYKIRYRFYKRYFGKNYKKIWRKYYIRRFKEFYKPYLIWCMKLKVKKIGIKRKKK